jgi:hypothetical protein
VRTGGGPCILTTAQIHSLQTMTSKTPLFTFVAPMLALNLDVAIDNSHVLGGDPFQPPRDAIEIASSTDSLQYFTPEQNISVPVMTITAADVSSRGGTILPWNVVSRQLILVAKVARTGTRGARPHRFSGIPGYAASGHHFAIIAPRLGLLQRSEGSSCAARGKARRYLSTSRRCRALSQSFELAGFHAFADGGLIGHAAHATPRTPESNLPPTREPPRCGRWQHMPSEVLQWDGLP